jgi:hypothetical protein
MKQKKDFSGWIILILYVLLISGCVQQKRMIMTESIAPTKSITHVPSPTIHPTPSITCTTIPTLIPAEKEIEFERLLQNNENCSGFCFWGIRSGETSFSTAIDFFRRFHNVKNIDTVLGNQEYIDSFSFDNEKYYIEIEISQNSGVAKIERIQIRGMGRIDTSPDIWSAFTLKNYLITNGKPEKFLVGFAEGPEGHGFYYLILKYHDYAVTYEGKDTVIAPNPFYACPLSDFSIESINIEPVRSPYFAGVIEQSQLTGISDDDFYKKFIHGSKNACILLDFMKYLDILNR